MDDLIQELYLTRNIMSLVETQDLIDYFHSNEKKRMFFLYKAQSLSGKEKEQFVMHFANKLIVSPWFVTHYLECSNTELKRWKDDLGYVKDCYTQGNWQKGYLPYFRLSTILSLKDSVSGIREKYKKILSAKRKEEARLRKENSPSFIKDFELLLPNEINNIKRYITIAKLANEEIAYSIQTRFNTMKVKVEITRNGIVKFMHKTSYIECISMKLNMNIKNFKKNIQLRYKTKLNNIYFKSSDNYKKQLKHDISKS